MMIDVDALPAVVKETYLADHFDIKIHPILKDFLISKDLFDEYVHVILNVASYHYGGEVDGISMIKKTLWDFDIDQDDEVVRFRDTFQSYTPFYSLIIDSHDTAIKFDIHDGFLCMPDHSHIRALENEFYRYYIANWGCL